MENYITVDGAVLVDKGTGECILDSPPGSMVSVSTEDEIRRKNARVQEMYPDRKNSGKMNPVYKKNGTFTWCVFDKDGLLFPDVGNVDLPRLMLLSSYMDYDNILGTDTGRTMRRKDMMQVLGLTDRSIQKFVVDLVGCDMMRHEGKLYWMGQNYFRKGHIQISEKRKLIGKGKVFKRIYTNGVRSLVDSVGIDNMRKLYYIFRIMPYVSQKFNIICHNPSQSSLELLHPMNYKDVAEILGCGRNNANRMLSVMTEPTLSVDVYRDKRTQKAVQIVDIEETGEKYMFINPALYYGGNDHGCVEFAMNYYRRR